MIVPATSPYAVTTIGEWRTTNRWFSNIQNNAITSDTTTNRSPATVGSPPAACFAWLSAISTAPAVDTAIAPQPTGDNRSFANIVAPIARITGIVPTISDACETVVNCKPRN